MGTLIIDSIQIMPHKLKTLFQHLVIYLYGVLNTRELNLPLLFNILSLSLTHSPDYFHGQE